MDDIPFFELQFDKKARLAIAAEWPLIEQALNENEFTDVIVLSHGWNNDMDEARRLYDSLLQLICLELDKRNVASRRFSAIGVLWPSKKFADKDLIPGGAANVEAGEDNAEAIRECVRLEETATSELTEVIKALRISLEEESEADELSGKLMNVIESINMQEEDGSGEERLGPVDRKQIEMMLVDEGFWEGYEVDEYEGGAMHAKAAERDGVIPLSFESGIKNGLRNVLNMVTYYLMKDRAGIVGRKGLNPILRKMKQIKPEIKIHLVGHSFGARLVSSAIMGEKAGDELAVDSLSLLQAAFSHYAFAERYNNGSLDGSFRSVITSRLVKGPFIITHTRNDRAVALAYAIASRLARQVGESVGDRNDIYGGLGGNGALDTGATDGALLEYGGKYDFEPSKIYNLKADDYISDHSDVKNRETAAALISAFIY